MLDSMKDLGLPAKEAYWFFCAVRFCIYVVMSEMFGVVTARARVCVREYVRVSVCVCEKSHPLWSRNTHCQQGTPLPPRHKKRSFDLYVFCANIASHHIPEACKINRSPLSKSLKTEIESSKTVWSSMHPSTLFCVCTKTQN